MKSHDTLPACDTTRPAAFSVAISALGGQLWRLAASAWPLGPSRQPLDAAQPFPADTTVIPNRAGLTMNKPSPNQRVTIDTHRDDWP